VLHWPNGVTDLSDVVSAFENLRSAGKIRAWGVSNFKVSDLEDLFHVPQGDRCATNQVLYNIGDRSIERDLLHHAHEDRAVKAPSPLTETSAGTPTLSQRRRRRSHAGSVRTAGPTASAKLKEPPAVPVALGLRRIDVRR